MRQGGHDLLGPGHLRHALGVDEGHHLHALRPGGFQARDHFQLLADLQQGLLVLQAVARADLHDLDLAAHHRLSLASTSGAT